jgi:endonuclease G, mitochondrial
LIPDTPKKAKPMSRARPYRNGLFSVWNPRIAPQQGKFATERLCWLRNEPPATKQTTQTLGPRQPASEAGRPGSRNMPRRFGVAGRPPGRRAEVRRREIDLACNAAEEWRLRKPIIENTQRVIAAGGPRAADTPARARAFVQREIRRSARALEGEIGFEARFGPTLDFIHQPPDHVADLAGNPVARLVDLSAAVGPQSGDATGFMISPDLLLTNYHVFPTRQDAEGVGAQFDYEEDRTGNIRAGQIFELDPRTFFVSTRTLDLALIAVKARNDAGERVASFGALKLIPTIGKILIGHPVKIIQHPDGKPKTYVVQNCELVDLDELHLRYFSDTDPGSSGSPAFNAYWELVALHHRSVPDTNPNGTIKRRGGGEWNRDMDEDEIEWLANEAVRVSAIVRHLSELQMPAPAEQSLLDDVLTHAKDPLGGEPLNGTTQPATRMTNVATSNGPNESPVSVTVHGTANFYLAPGARATYDTSGAKGDGSAKVIIGLEAVIRFDPDYDSRPGYDEKFLGGNLTVPVPFTKQGRLGEVLRNEQGKELVLPYHHYSLVMNAKRRLQMWSAVNVDYDDDKRRWFAKREDFGSDKWIADPRIPNQYQLMDADAYEPSRSLQRGHIVRRDDSAWGTSKRNQEFSNSDTFHWTNCTPQHGGFNQSSHIDPEVGYYQGIWGALENKVAALAEKHGKRMCIFGGPVLDNDNDDEYDWGMGWVQIPMKYWKVVIVREENKLEAYGFVLDQTQAFEDLGFERLNFGKFKTHQKPLTEISSMSGVGFAQSILAADVVPDGPGFEIRPGGRIRKGYDPR